jgi:hypothetical protein
VPSIVQGEKTGITVPSIVQASDQSHNRKPFQGGQTYFQVISDAPDSSRSSSRSFNCWRTCRYTVDQPSRSRT